MSERRRVYNTEANLFVCVLQTDRLCVLDVQTLVLVLVESVDTLQDTLDTPV